MLNVIRKRIPIGEQDVRYALFLGHFPHSLLVVEIRSVLGKPENPEVLTNLRLIQKSPDLLGRMDRSMIDRQNDSFPRVARVFQQPMDKDQKLERAFSAFGYFGNVVEMLSTGIVDGAEGRDFLVLTWRGDLGLFSSAHPHSCQMRMQVEIRLVFEPQFVASRRFQSPFFRVARRLSAA